MKDIIEVRSTFISQLSKLYSEKEALQLFYESVEFIKGWTKKDFITLPSKVLLPDEAKRFQRVLNRLMKNEPFQYISGIQHFYGRIYKVKPGVLIPRPETEELVEWVLRDHKDLSQVFEIGAGSGCIPITLKLERKDAIVQSIDISTEALSVAIDNNELHHAGVLFTQEDFLDESNWEKWGKYSVIISNPPYVTNEEKTTLAPRVVDFEPNTALFAPGNDPMIFYRKIGKFAVDHLSDDGAVYTEINQYKASEIVDIFKTYFSDVELRMDMSDNPRMIKAYNRISA
jgi:release factor glutamine methyltransferase